MLMGIPKSNARKILLIGGILFAAGVGLVWNRYPTVGDATAIALF